jgi:hypothetical protein
MTNHHNEIVNNPFACEHMGCNARFETKKSKLIHHYDMEDECDDERKALMELIKVFKKFLQEIVEEKNIDCLNDKNYIFIKKAYEDAQLKLFCSDYFCTSVGENLA